MCLIKHFYKKNLLTRYDKDGIIPYLSNLDFDGLQKEEFSFVNSKGAELACFKYHYNKYRDDKVIIFCHGIGPGHTAYIAEINELCRSGYLVITLDYMGCDQSKGDALPSINEPTRDVVELLNYLNLKEEIILIGHSLGGYTALNVMSRRNDIKKAVIISGFISVRSELIHLINSKLIGNYLYKYECKLEKEYNDSLIMDYLKTTDDKLLFIHSKDDQLVPFNESTEVVMNLNNPNIDFLIEEGKKHNPNYSIEAIGYMNQTFGMYNALIKNKTLKTLEDKQSFMADKSAYKMTIQDPKVIDRIIKHLS